MKNIIVTGGLGFIGSHFVETIALKYPDKKILVIDNCSTNSVDESYFLSNENVKVITKSIKEACSDLLNLKNSVERIYHFASEVGPFGILKHAGRIGSSIISNIELVNRLCDWHGCSLSFISTSEVYGYRNSAVSLKEEDHKVLVGNYTVRNEYSQAKLLAEIMIQNYALDRPNFRYSIFRPFNVCGPRQKPDGGFVIPRFVEAVMRGKDLTVFGEGKHIRSFVHVRDLVNAILTVDENPNYNNIWNIGNPNNTISILDLAEKIIKGIPKSISKVTFTDPKSLFGHKYADAWDKIANIDKIKTLVGWSPKYDLDDIIKDVINNYSN